MENFNRHSSNWTNFIYGTFFLSICMMGAGIFFLEANLWAKGFMAMAAIMNMTLSITITKTLRDNQEAERYQDFLRQHGKH